MVRRLAKLVAVLVQRAADFGEAALARQTHDFWDNDRYLQSGRHSALCAAMTGVLEDIDVVGVLLGCLCAFLLLFLGRAIAASMRRSQRRSFLDEERQRLI